jgi:hypothetical protein
VVFLLDNLGTCIMRVFHLPDIVCVVMKIKHVLLLD